MLHHSLALSPIVLGASAAIAIGGQNAATSPPAAFSPPAPDIIITSDVEYGTSGATRLAMDIYKPAQHEVQSYQGSCSSIARRAPNAAIDSIPHGRGAAASNDVMGFFPTCAMAAGADFRMLLPYLERHGAGAWGRRTGVDAAIWQRRSHFPSPRIQV